MIMLILEIQFVMYFNFWLVFETKKNCIIYRVVYELNLPEKSGPKF